MYNSTVLEEFEYSSVYSVNEEEPPTTHSLIINLPHHSVYLCHLLRKDLLLKVFQRLGVYKPDIHLPAESLGFPTGGLRGSGSCTPSVLPVVYPQIVRVCHCKHHHHLSTYSDNSTAQDKKKKLSSHDTLHEPLDNISTNHNPNFDDVDPT